MKRGEINLCCLAIHRLCKLHLVVKKHTKTLTLAFSVHLIDCSARKPDRHPMHDLWMRI